MRARIRMALGKFQKSFIEWLCTPDAYRMPSTMREWSAENHIHERTLVKWKRDPDFQREWQKRLARARVTPDRINDIYDALYEKATKDGSVQAAKLYLEGNNRLNPPNELLDEKTVSAVADLSDEELEALIAQAAGAELARRSGADDDIDDA